MKMVSLHSSWRLGLNWIKSILRTVTGLIAFAILFLTVVIIAPPIYIWRYFAIQTAKLKSGFGKILNPRDIFPYEEPSEKRGAPRCALVTTATLNGDMCVEEIRKIFQERVLNAKTVKGQLRYQELLQCEANWLGFRFLKTNKDFRIEDHVVECPPEKGITSLRQVHQYLMNQTFPRGRSPWQMILFRNAAGHGKVILGLRVHHSIADGLSELKLFVECLGAKPLVKAKAHEVKRHPLKDLQFRLNFPISLGNDCLNFWSDTVKEFMRGKLIKTTKKNCSFREVVVGLSETISIRDVKVIAKSYGVTSSAVIIAGVMGGLENFMRKMFGPQKKKEASLGYVLPLENHPEGLANHWASTYTTVPFGDIHSRSSSERLKSYNEIFVEMKCGTKRTFLKYSVELYGSCIVKLAKLLLTNRVCSIGMTNIAGDDEGFQIEGRDCTDFALSSGGLDGIEVLFCIMSYKGQFRVSVVSEKNVLEEDHVILLSEFVRDEFLRLRDGVISQSLTDINSLKIYSQLQSNYDRTHIKDCV